MASNVKGQQTLDDANARKKNAKEKQQDAAKEPRPAVDVALLAPADTEDPAKRLSDAIHTVMTPGSGFTKPKSLAALESIVDSNVHKGAAMWRKAADALLGIKRFRLWKDAVPTDGGEAKYASFVDYAERRFGFKKTYAYDLVKAAQRKPEALSETAARAELKAERAAKPLPVTDWAEKLHRIWERFESAAGDLRDRVALNVTPDAAEDDATIQTIAEYDAMIALINEPLLEWLEKMTPIPGQVLDIEADSNKPVSGGDVRPQPVRPLRSDGKKADEADVPVAAG